MKRISLMIFFALTICGAASAAGHQGDLGLGVIVGDVTGPTVKYFTGPLTAVDVSLGFSSDFDVVADYIWHSERILPQPPSGKLGSYIAVGPRFENRDSSGGRHGNDAKDKFGVRTMIGVNYWTPNAPFEIFGEIGPWFVFSPDTDTDFDGGLGVRYYVGTSAPKTHRR